MSDNDKTVLVAMAINDTEENGRTDYTKATLRSLRWEPHDLWLVDNASCDETKEFLKSYEGYAFADTPFLITNEVNIGTAEAINMSWRHRKPGQHCVKMDNDVLIHDPQWVSKMVEVLERDPSIGIVGLKRKDLIECPDHPEELYKSKLRMLSHEKNQTWIVVEDAHHIMGTCQMYSSKLLDRIGYLVQPGIYGFDDSLASYRSRVAGFKNVFLPHIEIEHIQIDPIDVEGPHYTGWKRRHAGGNMKAYFKACEEYRKGKDVYYNPFLA